MVVRETLPQHHLNGDDYMLLLHRIFHEDYNKLARMDRGNLIHFKRHVDRSMLSERNISKLPKCMSCLAAGQRRRTYRVTEAEIEVRRAGESLVMDIHVFVNTPGIGGVRYMVNFTDREGFHTTSYGIKTKDEAPDCLARLLLDYHKKFNLKNLKHLHSDQEASLSSTKTQAWMRDRGIHFTSSPTDTPELNGLAEETNKWLGHKTVALLHHSGREVQFWVYAYEYAVAIKNIMPFKTTKGLMSSKEFLLSQVPDASWFTVWGCKASVLEPRTEGRKDFHGKTVIGFMAGFSADDNPIAYKIYVPELSSMVYSTNVVFDQNIPPPSESYHQELRAVVVQEGPRMQLADVEAQILHKTYKDDEDGMLYDVKGVRMLKDRTMVADVAMHGSSKKLRTPIHVADVIRMIRAMDGAVLSTSALHRAI
jgi:hypothetical protein